MSALATYFVGRDAESDEAEIAGAEAIQRLQAEVVALRAEIRSLSHRTGASRELPGNAGDASR